MRTPFYRWEEVEAIAGRLHRQLCALRGEPIELPIDVDAVGEQLLGLSWLYEPIPEPRGTTIFAALHPEQRLIVLNERYVETFGRNEGLERFTKAHELGHWVLHVPRDEGRGMRDEDRTAFSLLMAHPSSLIPHPYERSHGNEMDDWDRSGTAPGRVL